MAIRSYRDLQVWQVSMELASEAYKLAASLPAQERYGLSSQIQRAAVSVPSNIAEGHARKSTKEYLRFVSIALGSLAEVETQVILAERLMLIAAPEASSFLQKAETAGKMLRKLQQALERKSLAPSR